MILVGYFIGTWKMSLKVQASAMAARNLLLTEPSAIGKSSQLITSGVPFCYNQGNIYEAIIIPTKRSLMPLFKTVQAEEF